MYHACGGFSAAQIMKWMWSIGTKIDEQKSLAAKATTILFPAFYLSLFMPNQFMTRAFPRVPNMKTSP